jgi:hypothetical protein
MERDRRGVVAENLAPLTTFGVSEMMHQYVAAGGTIDQVPERRPEWNDRDFHYDLRLKIGDRSLYIETILVDDDPDDPLIKVVSIHDV